MIVKSKETMKITVEVHPDSRIVGTAAQAINFIAASIDKNQVSENSVVIDAKGIESCLSLISDELELIIDKTTDPLADSTQSTIKGDKIDRLYSETVGILRRLEKIYALIYEGK